MKGDDDGVPAEVFRFSGGGVLALKGDAYTQLEMKMPRGICNYFWSFKDFYHN